MWEKWNRSARLSTVIYISIFALLLLFNLVSPYVADDFTYMYSFATDERIMSLKDIVYSMSAHARLMNGRLSAHFLVQLFMLLPAWIFDVLNATIFCLMIKLLTSLDGSGERNNLIAVGVFCAVWLYVPAFGQVILWQDGAINYLWSVVVALIFLIPFSISFMNSRKAFSNTAVKVCFLMYSFFMGSYSETVSAAAIFMVACLVLLDIVCNKQRLKIYDIGCIALAFLGYISIYLAPAQWLNKSVELSVGNILYNIVIATEMYGSFGVLVVIYAVLLVLNISQKTNCRIIYLSVVLLLGSLVANYIMIFASYYPDRSAMGAACLIVAANVVLFRPMIDNERFCALTVCTLVVLAVITVPHFLEGSYDIAMTWKITEENEASILESKQNGDMDIELPMFYPETKYSTLFNAKYLDMEDPFDWPNYDMARYYGVNSIIGVE